MAIGTLFYAVAFDRAEDGTLAVAPDDAIESRAEGAIRRVAADMAARHAGVIVWARTALDGEDFGEPAQLFGLGEVPEVDVAFETVLRGQWAARGTLVDVDPPKDGDLVEVNLLGVHPPEGDGVEPIPTELEGALLCICSAKDGLVHVGGSAFLVAPGIAMTAAHVVSDLIDRGLFSQVVAVGVASGQLRAWSVVSASVPQPGEVAVLVLEPRFPTSPSVKVTVFEISASKPAPGDRIVGLGIRPHRSVVAVPKSGPLEIATEAFSSAGVVEEFVGMRPSMATSAVFQTDLTTFNSMSGGPVFNSEGRVVGVVNSGILVSGDTAKDVTYCAVPWPAMYFELQPVWPRGARPMPYRLIDVCHNADRLRLMPDNLVIYVDPPPTNGG